MKWAKINGVYVKDEAGNGEDIYVFNYLIEITKYQMEHTRKYQMVKQKMKSTINKEIKLIEHIKIIESDLLMHMIKMEINQMINMLK